MSAGLLRLGPPWRLSWGQSPSASACALPGGQGWPERRFHALFDKVHRSDVLDRAWEDVRRNRGAAGIDRVTLADVEEYGVSRLLGELAAELKDGRTGC